MCRCRGTHVHTHRKNPLKNTKPEAIIYTQRTRKFFRRKKKKTLSNLTRQIPSKGTVEFDCVGHLLLGTHGPALRVLGSTSKSPVENTDFSSASGYPLDIASGLGICLMSISPSTGTLYGTDAAALGMQSVSGTCMCEPAGFRRPCVLGVLDRSNSSPARAP